MKGAFEYAIFLILSLPIVVIVIELSAIAFDYQAARNLQQYTIATIEQQNRYDKDIEALIDIDKLCLNCELEVTNQANRYVVSVNFPIKLNSLNFKKEVSIKANSTIIY